MEVKVIQRKFGCIATSLDEGSDLPILAKVAAIRSWKPAAEKVRVFGTPIEEEPGVSNAKMKFGHPTLKAIVEDHVKGLRSQGALIIAPPTVQIAPVCIQLTEWAGKKNMGIAWVFHAANKKVWGFTPAIARVLVKEIPETILFKGDEWSTWLESWVVKYVQPHRRFEADQFNLATDWQVKEEECGCKSKKKCKTKSK
jgi:hypothetical protein